MKKLIKSKKWTEQELRLLKKFYPNLNKESLMKKLPDRSWVGIQFKAWQIKSKRLKFAPYKSQKKWTKTELKLLKKYAPVLTRDKLLKLFPHRSWSSIYARYRKLGIDRKKFAFYNNLKKWKIEEINKLRKFGPVSKKGDLLKIFPDRSWNSIKSKANKLKIDRSKYRTANILEINIPKPSDNFSWWLGALAGDGCVSKTEVKLKVKDKEFALKFKNIGETLFKIKGKSSFETTPKRTKMHVIRFYSVKLAKYLDDWSTYKWPKTLNKKFGWVLRRKSYIANFLSGYFDAEGTAICEKRNNMFVCRIVYAISPKEIQKFVIKMLKKLNISSIAYKGTVHISRYDNYKKFVNLIGSCIPRKKAILKNLSKTRQNIFVYSMKDYNNVIKLRKKGYSINKIAQITKVKKPTIQKWIYKKYKPTRRIIIKE